MRRPIFAIGHANGETIAVELDLICAKGRLKIEFLFEWNMPLLRPLVVCAASNALQIDKLIKSKHLEA